MLKRISSLIMALLMVCTVGGATLSPNVASAVSDNSMLRYQDLATILPALSVSGKTASYSLNVRGNTNVNRIDATLQVQQLNNGRYVNHGSSWKVSSISAKLNTNGTKAVTSGYSYRLKVVITAHTNSGSSMVTVYS